MNDDFPLHFDRLFFFYKDPKEFSPLSKKVLDLLEVDTALVTQYELLYVCVWNDVLHIKMIFDSDGCKEGRGYNQSDCVILEHATGENVLLQRFKDLPK